MNRPVIKKTPPRATKKPLFVVALVSLFLFFLALSSVAVAERIEDIASFQGMTENQVVGYGLAVGLAGTGDTGNATMDAIANVLERMGLTVSPTDIRAKDTAAVIVTATLPPFPKAGMKIDVNVSALADAKNIQGGTLLLTPLYGPDGKVYALAQGPVSIGGFVGGGGGTSIQKNHPTAGRIPEGAIIQKNLPFTLGDGKTIKLFLHDPDFTTAAGIAKSINTAFGPGSAEASDPSTVKISIPDAYSDRIVDFISMVGELDVAVDEPAKVVINERTGTVIIGENVRIAPVAIANGNLTVEIKTTYNVSQPPPFAPSGSQTVVVPNTNVKVQEQKASLMGVSGSTLGEVVSALNSLGVTPRDLISIMQALKAAGALRADLEII
ncbi:MAG: flagellar basal body P-ring protein FlgI [Nitrospiraceae bacterium]|nr:flagellar basal body P-ring protein FlgI [Nitrospiraceae bacterium]MDA8090875.1 flagellar basal body P-ring protein FlgI [Nitrospiraceae bacterium]